MNTAIQTADNLAWKLAAVIQGWARSGPARQLEAERRPWTARTVELSLRLNSQPRRAMARTGGHVLGIVYEAGALVPDGTAAPEV